MKESRLGDNKFKSKRLGLLGADNDRLLGEVATEKSLRGTWKGIVRIKGTDG